MTTARQECGSLVVESSRAGLGGEKEKEKEAYRRLPTTLVQQRGIVKDQRGAVGVGVGAIGRFRSGLYAMGS